MMTGASPVLVPREDPVGKIIFAAVGDRVETLRGSEMTGLAKAFLGTLISVLAGLFPVIGWCLVIPSLKLFAVGAGSLALIGKLRR